MEETDLRVPIQLGSKSARINSSLPICVPPAVRTVVRLFVPTETISLEVDQRNLNMKGDILYNKITTIKYNFNGFITRAMIL